MSQDPNLTPEELENLVNEEFGEDAVGDDDFDFPADPDEDGDFDEVTDEEAEDLTASDEEYGQVVDFSTE